MRRCFEAQRTRRPSRRSCLSRCRREECRAPRSGHTCLRAILPPTREVTPGRWWRCRWERGSTAHDRISSSASRQPGSYQSGRTLSTASGPASYSLEVTVPWAPSLGSTLAELPAAWSRHLLCMRTPVVRRRCSSRGRAPRSFQHRSDPCCVRCCRVAQTCTARARSKGHETERKVRTSAGT